MKQSDPMRATAIDGELLDAIMANDTNSVTRLLKDGANPNCYEDKCYIRPLHFAAVYNCVEAIYPLLNAGAKIDARTAEGYTPLDVAIQLNHHEVVELLKLLGTNLVSLF